MKVCLICACGKNGEIGLNNKLLWNVPEDFKKFKDLTSHSVIIMGRNTFESLPGILPNRFHVVITSSDLEESFFVKKVSDIDEALKVASGLVNYNSERVWIIGRAQLYNYCLENDYIDYAYLSKIDFEGEADTFIDINLIEQKFNCVYTEEHEEINKDGNIISQWCFNHYKKRR